jgi:hypothetical protein
MRILASLIMEKGSWANIVAQGKKKVIYENQELKLHMYSFFLKCHPNQIIMSKSRMV